MFDKVQIPRQREKVEKHTHAHRSGGGEGREREERDKSVVHTEEEQYQGTKLMADMGVIIASVPTR